MRQADPNHDRRKFLIYAGFLAFFISLAAVTDRYLFRDQEAANGHSSSLTVYSVFIFISLISSMLVSGEEGNGFAYLCCGCHCPNLFSRKKAAAPATAETPLINVTSDQRGYGATENS